MAETDAKPSCYCGELFDHKTCVNDDIMCCNCFEIIGKGNDTNWCALRKCTFAKKNGFRNNVCNDCMRILPVFADTQPLLDQMLRFAIKTATQKINEKKETNELKLYAYRLRHTLLKIVNNYSS
eukprot:186975_1